MEAISDLFVNILHQIAEDYNLDREELVSKYWLRKRKEEISQRCRAMNKKTRDRCSYRSVPGTCYCKRHTYVETSSGPAAAARSSQNTLEAFVMEPSPTPPPDPGSVSTTTAHTHGPFVEYDESCPKCIEQRRLCSNNSVQ